MALWITGGRLVDPFEETIQEKDLLIDGGRIARIVPPGRIPPEPEIEKIDARNLLVLPGMIDMHVHLREPGQEHKETIETGGRAALNGGFVTVACMPNTEPVNDCADICRFILERARSVGPVRVLPVAAVTRNLGGRVLTDFRGLRDAGAVAVSDDGRPVSDPELMKKAMIAAAEHGLAMISHCEDLSLSAGGVMHQGVVSNRLGLRGIPSLAEEAMVKREIGLARETGCPVHIAHVSTAGSVRLIRKAKGEGIPVTAETAPHYFTLDHTAVMDYSTDAKMNPPLRTPDDVQTVAEALSEDVIDVIATDHAPHAPWEKRVRFEEAPFGIIGLDTALSLSLQLVRGGLLTLPQLIRKMTYNPAKILNLGEGRLLAGGPADLTIVDPEMEYVLNEGDLQSKSRNSPFLGKPLKGRNLLTMIGGSIVWKR
jgi:dihydroorotase